jgi:hypothetical protein
MPLPPPPTPLAHSSHSVRKGSERLCVCVCVMCVCVCVCVLSLPTSGDPSAAFKVLPLPRSAKNTNLVRSNVHFKCTRIISTNVIQNLPEKTICKIARQHKLFQPFFASSWSTSLEAPPLPVHEAVLLIIRIHRFPIPSTALTKSTLHCVTKKK